MRNGPIVGVGDRVEVLLDRNAYLGTVSGVRNEPTLDPLGPSGVRYEVTPDGGSAHLTREGLSYWWPLGWLRKLSILEVIAEQ